MVEILKIVLGCRAVQLDAPDKWGRTPLHITVGAGYGSMTALLLLRRWRVSERSRQQGTDASAHDVRETPRRLLLESFLDVSATKSSGGWRIDARDQSGQTPLQLAVNENHKKVARLLLRRGADPDLSRCEGSTLLHVICQKPSNYQYAFLKILFEVSDELGSRVSMSMLGNGSGRTALRLTLDFYGCTKATVLLLERGAPIRVSLTRTDRLFCTLSAGATETILTWSRCYSR
ncbi:unnamed protein product [Trichogramma brassicae]|uniref:Uncharacterized protein n=1 Tax=Trichogramma brassicae TaxID=86971 RepID=A0A6H5I1R0_9HYME|nr:unnamed protein product [Trichogramma brassicae]